MEKGETTILTKATSKSDSLRTTVPNGIVKHLGLKEGDKIMWEMKPVESKFVIVVKPMDR